MSRRVCKPCWATNCHQCVDPDTCPCNHWPLDGGEPQGRIFPPHIAEAMGQAFDQEFPSEAAE